MVPENAGMLDNVISFVLAACMVYRHYIKTTVSDKEDGDNSVLNFGTQTVVDTVEYKGLVPRTEYVMTAHLVYEETGEEVYDTDGKRITSSLIFATEEPNGKVEVEISFDAEHADIDDEGQTVRINVKSVGPKTGDDTSSGPYIVIGAVAALVIATSIIVWKRKK